MPNYVFEPTRWDIAAMFNVPGRAAQHGVMPLRFR
jgi:hypothetical protein